MEENRGKSFAQITLYNKLIKEMDDLYRIYAKNCNLSDTAFWILRILVLHAPGKAEILDEIERLKIALHSDSTSEEVFDELKIKL